MRSRHDLYSTSSSAFGTVLWRLFLRVVEILAIPVETAVA